MAQVQALHTVHRAGKRKGEQEVIKPGGTFEATGKQLEQLVAAGAVKVLKDDLAADEAPAKPSGKKTAAKPEPKAAETPAGDGLEDL
ncbi:hypothetical protein [uncultured Halomonas sp.]|mgnify:CR=1 FL=1|uniref:hypothetical protein n=1 Tax=uncultured Halomonas sp. TaxID=173971 RepID=UPI0026278305|nr:hypothetical protein [uncultured Halomonas sp.]